MAKQSGLHQIRGKVGEHSYYRQTGVSSGLIRSINQGLSSRVKTSDEYANTRLNNAEFGQAGRIAKVLGMLITPKYRPMVLPFSQSKMAKILLAAIKTEDAPWGQRNLPVVNGSRLEPILSALNAVSKGDFDEFGFSVSRNVDQEIEVETDTTIYPSKMQGISADGCMVRVVCASPLIGLFDGNTGDYAKSFARGNMDDSEFTAVGGDISYFNGNFPPNPPAGSPTDAVRFLLLIVMPYRTINNTKYILQEHCTFTAIQNPVAP